MVPALLAAVIAGVGAGVVLTRNKGTPVGPLSRPSATPEPTTTSEPTTPHAISLGASCENDQDGYRLEYPKDWYTVTDLPEWRCALFDPLPIIVEPYSELPPTAILAYADTNPYRDVLDGLTDEAFYRVGEVMGGTFTDASLQGTAMHVRQTEDLLYPRGTRFFYVVIDRIDQTMVVMTTSLANGVFAENVDIALEMARRIELTG